MSRCLSQCTRYSNSQIYKTLKYIFEQSSLRILFEQHSNTIRIIFVEYFNHHSVRLFKSRKIQPKNFPKFLQIVTNILHLFLFPCRNIEILSSVNWLQLVNQIFYTILPTLTNFNILPICNQLTERWKNFDDFH